VRIGLGGIAALFSAILTQNHTRILMEFLQTSRLLPVAVPPSVMLGLDPSIYAQHSVCMRQLRSDAVSVVRANTNAVLIRMGPGAGTS
jgi:hypothetical protein